MALDGQSRVGLNGALWSNAAESAYRRLAPTATVPPTDRVAKGGLFAAIDEASRDREDSGSGGQPRKQQPPPQTLDEQARRKLEALARALGREDLVLDPMASYQFLFNGQTGLVDLQQLTEGEPVVVLSLTLKEIQQVSQVLETCEGMLADRIG